MPDFWYITPLALTLLPLIRIVFRHNPPLRNRLFAGAIGAGLVHGTWLILRSNQVADHPEVFYQPHQVRTLSGGASVASAGAGAGPGSRRSGGGEVGVATGGSQLQ